MNIKKIIYDFIRPLFVDDIDQNEDFVCCICNKPVLTRILTCSNKCYKEFNKKYE